MAWLCFCRRDFLQGNNIEFLPIISEDETFSFALFCLTERYYVLHEAFYVYRRRTGSIINTFDADRFSKAIHAMIVGSAYIEKFLDRIPRFNNYEQWREGFMNVFFTRFSNHTSYYYKDLKMLPDNSASAKKMLAPLFGEREFFVRFFFNGYHLHRRQSEFLNQELMNRSMQIMALFNRIEISSNKIVFVNFMGRGYGCNPKYIAQEILKQNLPYDLVWIVGNLNEPMPDKIRKVLYGSMDSVYELATAKVIVTNVKNLLPYPNKKQGQYFIMTWHGGQSFKNRCS